MNVGAKQINSFLGSCVANNWAGVFYSFPNQTNFQFWLQNLNQTHEQNNDVFTFHPFSLKDAPVIQINPTWQNESAIKQLENGSGKPWVLDRLNDQQSTKFQEYQDCFVKTKELIHKGVVTKMVLSTVTRQPYGGDFDLGRYVLQLRKYYPNSFVYLFSSPISGTWIGASPELLLSGDKTGLKSISLAGTSKSGDANQSRFGDKEKHEQKLVTDYIQSYFQERFGNVTCFETEEIEYGDLAHLQTKIESIPNVNWEPEKLPYYAVDLHPTPAVAGVPKDSIDELIRQLEAHKRDYYTGFLGPMEKSSGSFMVNLRCMTILKDAMLIYAGGGITKESELESEWNETRSKSEALIRHITDSD